MQVLSLNGLWELFKAGEEKSIPAAVPGCVHTDLLAAGKIEDPYYRDNELKTMWIGETDWIYRRSFQVSPDLLEHERVLLRCEGLDCLARVSVNGELVGRTDNMFCIYEFDVKSLLIEGNNEIEVYFEAPLPYLRAKEKEHPMPAWGVGSHKVNGGGWLRKSPCNFGWDWGPMLTTCGIWRDISLAAYSTARLSEVAVRQNHDHPDGVLLGVEAVVENLDDSSELTLSCNLSFDGQLLASEELTLDGDSGKVEILVENPQLWWPVGMGDQPLYDLEVTLLDSAGQALDTDAKRLGLRTLELDRHADKWGESFQFIVNGVPFFAKGANWIPADTFPTRLTEDDYRRLLQDAAEANMNMLRVWGGGIYENDVFYDICDELGICVWQDFMFACSTYPGFDEQFLASVRREASDNVRRLRHHACLALWCGNNELEQGLVGDEWNDHQMSWPDYKRLFDELLPSVVQRLDPDRAYWPSSPHTPCGDRRDFNNPSCGDAHLWNVWHGKQPFEWYRTCRHRFASEFGFQSFPEPKTVESYTLPEDRNITSYIMEHHQRSGIGNSTIIHYMLDWFRLPTSFEGVLWASQILQGLAMKYAIENWRRIMPRCMGTLYWQLNDCWPVASWSSIDSFGRWKALHYMARRFYAPLLVSAVEDAEAGTVEVHVTSDLLADQDGRLLWSLLDVEGNELTRGEKTLAISAQASTCVDTLNLGSYLADPGARRIIFYVELVVGDQVVSSNLATFARPKHLELVRPRLTTEVVGVSDAKFELTLSSDRPALWVWLELEEGDCRFSDNFVHLMPGRPLKITAQPEERLSAEELRCRLRVRSLIDTYTS